MSAYESIDAFVDALRAVAPRIDLDRPITVYRGVMVPRDVHPAETAIGLSWTTSRDVACWLATVRAGMAAMQEARGSRPFVFAVEATAQEIITPHDGRTALTATECEALLETGAARPVDAPDHPRRAVA